jgi:hypothetical protein
MEFYCCRISYWLVVFFVLMFPGFFLLGIIGRIAGFRPGSKVGGVEMTFGWVGILFLGVLMLGICLIGGLVDYFIFNSVWPAAANQPHRPGQPLLRPIATPKPIPADWNEAAMKATYLSDMQEFDVRVGWGAFGKNGNLGYVLPGGDRVKVDGKEYPKAISPHPPTNGHSTVKYRFGGLAKLFKATAAFTDFDNNFQQPATNPTFEVWGDGVLLWSSTPLRRGEVQNCRISIQGVDVLELQIHCPGSHSHVRAVWLEPHVLR